MCECGELELIRGQSKKASEKDKKYWAKGTGYGTPDDDRASGGWNIAAQSRKQELKAAQLLTLLRGAVNEHTHTHLHTQTHTISHPNSLQSTPRVDITAASTDVTPSPSTKPDATTTA